MAARVRKPTVRVHVFKLLVLGAAGDHIYHLVISPKLFPEKRKRQPYENLPLQEDTKDIRLLVVQPGSPWARIRCDLAVASLEPPHVPKYYALSYTWNEPIQPSAPLMTFRGFRQHVRALYWHYCRPSHETILINGLPFPVTRNLATALRHLRSRKKPTPFWVDAICINQNDDAEKSRQLRLMPDIYSKAKATCIWLGPEADGSNEAMEFIDSAPKIKADDANLDVCNQVPTRALTALFSRSWWQRVWVMQEAVLSRNAVVICGKKAAHLSDFQTLVMKERAMRKLTRSASRVSSLDSPNVRVWYFIPPILPFYTVLMGMGMLRKRALENTSTEKAAAQLAELIEIMPRFQSTLPRDKVYGLLGLVPVLQRDIVPSYGPEKTDGDVFKELTVFLTRWTNSIGHIFAFRKPEMGRLRGAPSWAIYPVLTPTKGGRFEDVPGPLKSSQYRADGGFWTWLRLTPMDVIRGYNPQPPTASAATTDSANSFWQATFRFIRERLTALASGEYGVNPEFSADLNTLRLHGLVFDTVVAASPGPSKTYTLDIYHVSDPTPTGWWASLWEAMLCYHRLRQLVSKWQAFVDANTNLDSETTASDPYVGVHGEMGIRAAFWRAIVANQIREPDGSFGTPDDNLIKEILPIFTRDSNPMSWEYWGLGDSPTSEALQISYRLYTAECFRAATGRSLILTRKGFLGLAPVDSQMGDVVCVVRGCKIPILLRPVAGKERIYRLVGDCYVHGIMDGSFAHSASWRDVKSLKIV